MTVIKPFIAQKDEFIQLHNSIFDHIMPTLKPNSWKVLCFILRKTKGWKKTRDRIPYSQIHKGTGIKHWQTIKAALDDLTNKEYIIAHEDEDEQWMATLYELNMDFEIEVKSPSRQEPTAKNAVEPTAKNAVEPTAKNAVSKDNETYIKNNNALLVKAAAMGVSDSSPRTQTALSPESDVGKKFFELVNVERAAQSKIALCKFPSLESRRRFDETAERLGIHLADAISAGLSKGIISVPGLVNYMAKWQVRENGNGHNGYHDDVIDENELYRKALSRLERSGLIEMRVDETTSKGRLYWVGTDELVSKEEAIERSGIKSAGRKKKQKWFFDEISRKWVLYE